MPRYLFLAVMLFIFTCAALFCAGDDEAAAPGFGRDTGATAKEGPYFLLHRAMEMAEARVVKGELHYWASLEQAAGQGAGSALTPAGLEGQADALLSRLSPRFVPASASTRVERDPPLLPEGPYRDSGALPSIILVEREGAFYHNGRLRLLLQGKEEGGEQTVHLFITIFEEGEARRLGELVRRLPPLLEINPRRSSLTFSLTGLIPASLEGEEMELLAREIAAKLGARRVESIREEFMVSVTGYTPLLPGGSGPHSLPVNLNLALRPAAEGGSTVIWIGTPLISGMY